MIRVSISVIYIEQLMTGEQIREEKTAVQKILLRFESLHGRPVNHLSPYISFCDSELEWINSGPFACCRYVNYYFTYSTHSVILASFKQPSFKSLNPNPNHVIHFTVSLLISLLQCCLYLAISGVTEAMKLRTELGRVWLISGRRTQLRRHTCICTCISPNDWELCRNRTDDYQSIFTFLHVSSLVGLPWNTFSLLFMKPWGPVFLFFLNIYRWFCCFCVCLLSGNKIWKRNNATSVQQISTDQTTTRDKTFVGLWTMCCYFYNEWILFS